MSPSIFLVLILKSNVTRTVPAYQISMVREMESAASLTAMILRDTGKKKSHYKENKSSTWLYGLKNQKIPRQQQNNPKLTSTPNLIFVQTYSSHPSLKAILDVSFLLTYQNREEEKVWFEFSNSPESTTVALDTLSGLD